ncbi:MAG: right-handed parallel beta-helix repeat-containing protein, partial [Candidatus Thermoplasmatota archaeon]|nr:right-handed parallel beta-helix repeat-containing protein [Candidatus Thermoplasmatota archaeon]
LLSDMQIGGSNRNEVEEQGIGDDTRGALLSENNTNPSELEINHESYKHSFDAIQSSIAAESKEIISPHYGEFDRTPLRADEFRPSKTTKQFGALPPTDMKILSYTASSKIGSQELGTIRTLEPLTNVPGPWLPPMNNDRAGWTVTNHTYLNDTDIELDGNIIVQNGGNLTLNNVTIRFNCTYDGEYKIDVLAGGSLWVIGSHITAVDPNFEYDWWFRAGSYGSLHDSTVEECGYENGGSKGMHIMTDDCRVSSSVFKNNWIGILCNLSSPVIVDNFISNNNRGINCEDSPNPILYNNNISYNREVGIACFSSSPEIRGNNISNSERAIHLQGPSVSRIEKNSLSKNSQFGISFSRSSPIIMDNNITRNILAGLYCFSSSGLTPAPLPTLTRPPAITARILETGWMWWIFPMVIMYG